MSSKDPGAAVNEKKAAIGGYDPVAYFESGKAIPGVPDYRVEYEGEFWLFSSHVNQKTFESSPENFVPQYGGYCSWAMAKGKRVEVNPECFAVVNDKLYLNYSKRIHKRWQRRMQRLIESADMQWASQKKGSR